MVRLIKTPKKRLPIGEPIRHEDGSLSLRVKGKGQVYEEISLAALLRLMQEVPKVSS